MNPRFRVREDNIGLFSKVIFHDNVVTRTIYGLEDLEGMVINVDYSRRDDWCW